MNLGTKNYLKYQMLACLYLNSKSAKKMNSRLQNEANLVLNHIYSDIDQGLF